MENSYLSFEDLMIWQEGMQLSYKVYDVLQECHDFGLRNQMERSAVSVPSKGAKPPF